MINYEPCGSQVIIIAVVLSGYSFVLFRFIVSDVGHVLFRPRISFVVKNCEDKSVEIAWQMSWP